MKIDTVEKLQEFESEFKVGDFIIYSGAGLYCFASITKINNTESEDYLTIDEIEPNTYELLRITHLSKKQIINSEIKHFIES